MIPRFGHTMIPPGIYRRRKSDKRCLCSGLLLPKKKNQFNFSGLVILSKLAMEVLPCASALAGETHFWKYYSSWTTLCYNYYCY